MLCPGLTFPVLLLEIKLLHAHHFFVIWILNCSKLKKKGRQWKQTAILWISSSRKKDFTLRAVINWEKVPKDVQGSSSLEKFKNWPNKTVSNLSSTGPALSKDLDGIFCRGPIQPQLLYNHKEALFEFSCTDKNQHQIWDETQNFCPLIISHFQWLFVNFSQEISEKKSPTTLK